MTSAAISSLPAARVFLLPGWQGSGPSHWQSRWAELHGDQRIEQDDWQWPRRGDWMSRLEETLLAQPDGHNLLVAHSLGCHLVSAWAAHSGHTGLVRAALLVAPPDLDRADLPPQLAGWRGTPRPRLPFLSHLVHSSNDVYCDPARALQIAHDWGSGVTDAGALGHLNAESGLGDWPEGRSLLLRLGAPPQPDR